MSTSSYTSFYSKGKTKLSNYKSALQDAYYKGYQSGYSDAAFIPKTFGAKTSAVKGYSNAITGYRQVRKSNYRLSKGNNY